MEQLMPKSKTPSNPPQNKTQFVLSQDPKLPVAEVVKLAKAAGISMKPQLVHNVRWTAKHKKKPRPASSRPKSGATPIAAPSAARAKSGAPRAATGTIAGISPLDLAYAVGRLVSDGKTTVAEVAMFASERVARITSLESELSALRHGSVPAKVQAQTKIGAKPRQQSGARPAKTKTGRTVRKFTMTPKALAARKIQAQYMSALRRVPASEIAKFKAIAKAKGVAAALAELEKRIGKR
jgi:hypothetical protein